MNKTLTSAAAVVALIALPVGAAGAKPGNGNGHGNGNAPAAAVQDTHTVPSLPTADGSLPVDEAPPARAPRRCRRPQSVGFAVKGSLASFTPEDVTLDVARANKHARSYIAAAGSTFTLGSARVRYVGVTDGNGDGTVDLADVLPTDRIVATGKATRPKRGCEGDSVLTLRKLQVVRPEVEEEEVEDEA